MDAASVEIVWRKDGSKDREVHVNQKLAFRQTVDEAIDSFLHPYQTLQI